MFRLSMKLYLVLIMLASSFSCNYSFAQNFSAELKNPFYTKEDKIIETLKEFYSLYMQENILNTSPDNKRIDYLKNKYLTKELQNRIKKANLDYDVIVDAQDYDEIWAKTIEVNAEDKTKNIYKVCYMVNEKKICIKLSVIEKNNQYIINNIFSNNL